MPAGRTIRARGVAAALATLTALLVTPGAAAAPKAPLIAAAGDIACGPSNPRFNRGFGIPNSCQQLATSNLLGIRRYAAILPLGDLQYDDDGSLASFGAGYEPSWGRFRAISRPVVGNHEYDDGLGAKGYWDYWNGIGVGRGRAGTRRRGWYSYNIGSWHLIALNSNCGYVPCGAGSRQVVWLRRELRRNTDRCVLAYMHHPRFSSGIYEEPGRTRGFWRSLYTGGADVVLAGHDHLYERFAPQRPSGQLDRRRGIVQFTVGTGGYFLFGFGTPRAHSRFRWNGSFGILAMRLGRGSFGWSYLTAPDGTRIDHGSHRCHNQPIVKVKPKHKRHKQG